MLNKLDGHLVTINMIHIKQTEYFFRNMSENCPSLDPFFIVGRA